MVRECFKVKTGILFLSKHLGKIGLDPSRLYLEVGTKPSPRPADSGPHYWETERPEKPSLIQRSIQRLKDETEPDQEPVQPSLIQRLIGHLKDKTEPVPEHVEVSEEEEDFKDALSPMHDQLKLAWSWWILEFLFPVVSVHQ